MPFSNSPTRSWTPRGPWDRCPPSAWSRSSGAPTAASTRLSLWVRSTRGRCGPHSWHIARVEWPAVFAVDASTWERCDAECSPERGFYYSASKHSAGQPIVAGWSYQWIAQLSFEPNSWTAPLDALRIAPGADATEATIAQVKALVALLREDRAVPLFVFDAGYDPIALSHGLDDTEAQVLVRIREDRVFYDDPAARPNRPKGTGGRPPRHGRRMKCSEDKTHRRPDAEYRTEDPRYGKVRVRGLARAPPSPHWSRALGQERGRTTNRARQRDPRRRRAPSQTRRTSEEDVVAVVVGSGRARSRPVLPVLSAPFRSRAHLPIRQEHFGLDGALAVHARTGRPLDVVDRGCLHPVANRTRTRRRRTAAVGASLRAGKTDPSACAQRVSSTSCNSWDSGQCTEIRHSGSRTPQGHPERAATALSGGQEGRLTGWWGFNCKLRIPHDPSPSLSIKTRKDTPERSRRVATDRCSRPICRLSQYAATDARSPLMAIMFLGERQDIIGPEATFPADDGTPMLSPPRPVQISLTCSMRATSGGCCN